MRNKQMEHCAACAAAAPAFNDGTVAQIVAGFCAAAAWADSEEGNHPRFSNAERANVETYVRAFLAAYPQLSRAALDRDDYGWWQGLRNAGEAFGHDLYLTARGHGAGFADRDALGALAQPLHDVLRNGWKVWEVELMQSRGWLYLSHRAPTSPMQDALHDVVPADLED